MLPTELIVQLFLTVLQNTSLKSVKASTYSMPYQSSNVDYFEGRESESNSNDCSLVEYCKCLFSMTGSPGEPSSC